MVRAVDGRGFAFVPRSLVTQPAAFGLVPDLLDPAAGVDPTDERYRAAMVQHLMCFEARAAVRLERGISPAQYVKPLARHGLGEDRVRRVFRGATMAQLTDLVFWTAEFPEVGRVVSEYLVTWVPATAPRQEAATLAMQGGLGEAASEGIPAPTPSLNTTSLPSRVDPVPLVRKAAGLKQRRSPQHPF